MNEENLLEMAKEYNHVFETLVSAPDDIVGTIPYKIGERFNPMKKQHASAPIRCALLFETTT